MSADYVDDDVIFDTQWLAMKRAINGDGILSGLAVTPGTGMNVSLADGVFYADLTKRTLSGGPTTIAIDAAHATYDRWDLISGKDTGTPVYLYTAGTAAAVPKPPDLPSSHILISMIYVPATITQILGSHIHDFGFWSSLLEHGSRHLPDNGDGLSVGTPSDIGTSNQEGSFNAFVRRDHVHKHPSGLGEDLHHSRQHGLGSTSDHSSATLAQLNALISDATLDKNTDLRDPNTHALGGAKHTSATLAQLNNLISDATLDDESGDRPPEIHDHNKHTDRTRRIAMGVGHFEVVSGDTQPPITRTTLGGVIQVYHKFGNINTDPLCTTIFVPEGYVGDPVIQVIFTKEDAGSGAVTFRVTTTRYHSGAGAVEGTWFDSITVPATVGDGKAASLPNTAGSSAFAPNDFVSFRIERVGGGPGDTYTGDIALLAVYFTYTADE